jgi:hypothetical protein
MPNPSRPVARRRRLEGSGVAIAVLRISKVSEPIAFPPPG